MKIILKYKTERCLSKIKYFILLYAVKVKYIINTKLLDVHELNRVNDSEEPRKNRLNFIKKKLY